MIAPSLVICVYALVALLYCGVAIVQQRSPTRLLPRGVLACALVATALWALAVAGIGERDAIAHVAGSARTLAWLAVLWVLARGGDARATGWRAGAYVATAFCAVLAASVSAIQPAHGDVAAAQALGDTALALRMLATAAALVLAHRLLLDGRGRAPGGRQVLVAALALMWSADLVAFLTTWMAGEWPVALTVVRGVAVGVLGLLVAFAVHRDGRWTLRMSRTVALRGVMLVAITLYVVATVVATGLLASVGGDHARVVQTAFAFGTATAVCTIVSTPWLRAWAKVIVAKHLFSHRYDYRAEWIRFTATLALPGEHAPPLATRVTRAIADLTASPAALLLERHDDTLRATAAWQWDGTPDAGSAALVRHLEASARIVALDAVRRGTAPADELDAIPAWLVACADAWALVPLIHGDRLVGAVALARPPVDRALDWEDFDLLGVAGRHAASHLAEERAHAALAEAQRFEEFNRRFAFIMHDLKNLVSQLALVARNAERHAENPEFRADMIATLRDSSQRMTTLLQRLSSHAAAPVEPPRATALLALAERVADARRAQHPVIASGADVFAVADPCALELVLGHLIQNAVEASAAGAPVRLDVGVAGGCARLDVIDRGSGMSAAFVRDALFRPFASHKPGGFGLGAFEARQLVEAMGGRVEVESREAPGSERGTRFRLLLPLAPAMEEAA